MRRGFTLVEILVVVMLIPFVAMILDRLFADIVTDIPRSSRVVQEHTIVLDMLRHVQEDMDRAVGVDDAGDGAISIQLADTKVHYEFVEERVLRRQGGDGDTGEDAMRKTWSLPNTVIDWRIRREGDAGSALEIQTHIRRKLRKKVQEKMANSHVYFVGAL